MANKKADIVRIYLPPDANCLLSVADHCLRSRNYVNLIIAGKQPEWQWLDIDSAVRHCTAGAGIWRWASNDAGNPDVVMACAGDVPTLETLAAVTILRGFVPDIRIRVVNVVDLMVLQPQSEHPHGLEDQDFDELFTTDKPVIFAFHGYPAMVHKLTYRRHNHDNFHVRGYKEEGTTTTPFDMVVLNNLDRYQLALDAINRIPRFSDPRDKATAALLDVHGAPQALCQRAWRRYAGGPRLALGLVSAHASTVMRSNAEPESHDTRAQQRLFLAEVRPLSCGSFRTEMLVSGEAEAIGDGDAKFNAEPMPPAIVILSVDGVPIRQPGRRSRPYWQVSRRRKISYGCGCRASCRAWRPKTFAALPDRWMRF